LKLAEQSAGMFKMRLAFSPSHLMIKPMKNVPMMKVVTGAQLRLTAMEITSKENGELVVPHVQKLVDKFICYYIFLLKFML